MDFETANNPAPEASEAPAPELASEVVGDTQQEHSETGFGDDNAEPGSEEEIEFDYNGKPLKLPKSIAEQLADVEETKKSIQRDATQKWQDAAEIRKQAQAEREAFLRERQVHEELSDELAAVKWIDNRLHQLQQLDVRTLTMEQQVQYSTELNRLMFEKQNRAGQIEAKKSELTAQQEQFAQHTLRQAISELQKPDDKFGWSGKFDKAVSEDLTKFALDAGFTMEEVRNTNHPVMIKLLHLAKMGQAALKERRTTPARPPAQPAAKVPAAKAPSTTGDPNKMSMSQYAQWRKRQGA